MTTPTPTVAAVAPARPRPFPSRHSLALARRSLIKILRTPEQLLDVTLQPIIFVRAVRLPASAARSPAPRHDYLQFVLPAIMVQTVLFASMATGVNLNTDIKKGVFDRFRSLPIARSAPLVGAVLGDLIRYVVAIVVLLGFGYALGFRIGTDPLSALAALPARDRLRVQHELGVRASSACWCGSRAAVQGLGFLVHVPADLRQQHVRADRRRCPAGCRPG